MKSWIELWDNIKAQGETRCKETLAAWRKGLQAQRAPANRWSNAKGPLAATPWRPVLPNHWVNGDKGYTATIDSSKSAPSSVTRFFEEKLVLKQWEKQAAGRWAKDYNSKSRTLARLSKRRRGSREKACTEKRRL